MTNPSDSQLTNELLTIYAREGSVFGRGGRAPGDLRPRQPDQWGAGAGRGPAPAGRSAMSARIFMLIFLIAIWSAIAFEIAKLIWGRP